MDCIATLSDWSEYTNPKDEADYVTIYPLQNSEYYIISKTWYAGEMKRPGCVWTHSFLIPFSQLSQITDFRIFTDLFVRPQDDNIDFLFRAILELETIDDCYDFFEDLCTVQELKTISQRIVVAKMLSEKCVYTDIVNATGASTATISRVNRSLQYGCDGYDKIFEKIKLEDENKNEENEEL